MKKIINFLLKHIYETISTIVCILCLITMISVLCMRTNNSYSYQVFRDSNRLEMEAIKCEIVHEIDNYIQLVAPNSSVNGLAIFEACQEYNVDVIFVLAQGQIESHFGTTGIAAKTNSIFNVLAYDGRSARDMIAKGHGYDHPDKSIRPYLDLLSNRYFVNGKTEYDMFKKYVDKDGNRYASNTSYEDSLFSTYTNIKESTNIYELTTKYRKYRIITNED